MTNYHITFHPEDRSSTIIFIIETVEVLIANTSFVHQGVKTFSLLQCNVTGKTVTYNHICDSGKQIAAFDVPNEIDLIRFAH
ncbi:hypothetical protein D3C86_1749760 [compost metagenome]